MKNKNNIELKSLSVLLITLLISAWLSLFRINDNDRVWFTLNLPDEANNEVWIDIANLNLIKYYLQPGTISLYGRIKNPMKLTDLNAEFAGTEAFMSQGSKKSKWAPIMPTDFLYKDKLGNIRINIEIQVPYNKTREHNVGEAILKIKSKGKDISSVRFHILNSKY